MTETWFSLVFPLLFAVIFVLAISEFLLSSFWAPVYFRYGIPLLRRSYTVPADLDLAAQIPHLETSLPRTWWRPGVVFRALSPTELAFRHRFGTRNPLQGLVRLEPGHGRMTITGYLYSFYLVFPFLILFFVLVAGVPWLFLLFMAAVFAFTFGLQRRHYAQIADIIAATVGAQPAVGTAVSRPSFPPQSTPYKPDSQTTPWSPETNDPFAPKTSSPGAGLSNLELLLIALLVVLAGAVGWFLLLLFTGA
ncbi:MAG: hypothetical protein IPM39_14750 [Chloroflexi bacterium]|nr:hypothetical protein [Chloroflexota bacterium]